MQEKRISVRTNLIQLDAKISRDGKNWEEISSHDISDGGLGFSAEGEYEKGEQLMLQGEVTDFTKTMDISCNIKIVFSGIIEGRRHYGVKFLDMHKYQHTGLSIFIELIVTKYPSLFLM